MPVLAGLATRHGKEQVIGPVLLEIGWDLRVVDVDTDRYGTFTRTIPRAGTQLEAARAKASAALAGDRSILWGLGSEGALGPDPRFPFLTLDQEVVLAVRRDGLEVVGRASHQGIPWGSVTVTDRDDAHDRATDLGFPEHGLIIGGPPLLPDGPVEHAVAVYADWSVLESAIDEQLRRSGEVWMEVDGRAHRHRWRRYVIQKATSDLAERLATSCPACGEVGFGRSGRRGAAPCEDCGTPTSLPTHEVDACVRCGHEHAVQFRERVEPQYCPRCNP
jgi:hypothetical protein